MRTRERASLIVTAAAVTFACLAVGGVLRWTACVAAALGIASAVPLIGSRRVVRRPSILLLPLAVMAFLTAFQLLPLPIAVAALISPAKVELIRDNARAWGESPPSWVALSFDPPATLVELAKFAGYLGLAWTCTRLAADRHSRRWLLVIPVAAAVATAIVTWVHFMFDVRDLYGVYTTATKHAFLGPFLNVNHLSSLFALASPLALGLALHHAGPSRWVWIAVAAGLIASAFFTGSRGGFLGVVVGVSAALSVFVMQRRIANRQSPGSALSLPAIVSALAVLVLFVSLTSDNAVRELSQTKASELNAPEGKVQLGVRAARMALDVPWIGVGKGAFELAFTPFSATGRLTYSHVENGYIQTLVDWGVVGGGLVLLALGATISVGSRRWNRGPLAAGSLGAVAALAVHELADFSIELPGVAMAVIAAAASLLPAELALARTGGGTEGSEIPRRRFLLRTGWLFAGLVPVGLAASPIATPYRKDITRVAATKSSDRLDVSRQAFDRHPASFSLAAHAASALFELRDRRALPMAARAAAMNAQHSGVRLLIARMLLQTTAPAQAAVEFAAAARWAKDVRPIVNEVLAAFSTPELVARALPLEPPLAESIIAALGERRQEALAYASRLAEMFPTNGGVQSVLARAAFNAGALEIASSAARTAWDLTPSPVTASFLGQVLNKTGDTRQAIDILGSAIDRLKNVPHAEMVPLLHMLASLYLETGQPAAAKELLERCIRLAGNNRSTVSSLRARLAAAEEQLGNRNQAAWERARAEELSKPE